MSDGHTAAIVAAIAILASTLAGSASAAAPLGSITEFPVSAGTVPYGIAAGADGNLWFTDGGATPSIGRITPAGVMTEFSIGLKVGSAPNGIALGPREVHSLGHTRASGLRLRAADHVGRAADHQEQHVG